MQVMETFNKMTLQEKALMLEAIVFKDTLIFNHEHKSLDNGHEVAHICINEDFIQLTIHRDSNVSKENHENN